MELQNGYKVVYEVAADGSRTFYAAKSNVYPAEGDTVLATFTDTDYEGKLIYEYKGKFYVSANGNIPSYDENGEPTDNLLFNEDKFNEVFVKKVEEPTPASLDSGDGANTPDAGEDHLDGDETEDPETEE